MTCRVPRGRARVRGRRAPRAEDRVVPRPTGQPGDGRIDVGRPRRARRVRRRRRIQRARGRRRRTVGAQRRSVGTDARRGGAQHGTQPVAPRGAGMRARHAGRRRVRGDVDLARQDGASASSSSIRRRSPSASRASTPRCGRTPASPTSPCASSSPAACSCRRRVRAGCRRAPSTTRSIAPRPAPGGRCASSREPATTSTIRSASRRVRI